MVSPQQAARGGVPAAAQRSGWYVVALCTLAFVLSYADRQVLALLVQPIERDLGLSDTQFGLLQGLAFTLFYAVAGIPIASAADRVSRPAIVAAGIAVWSAATVACGFARNFTELLLARMMVGAGEATLSPATYALIADLFPRERQGRATAVYSLGSFFGAGIAFLVGGAAIAALEAHGAVTIGARALQPWQLVLVFVGAPGLLLAAIFALTVRDPRRHGHAAQPGWGAVLHFLVAERRIFVPHLAGYSFAAMALFAFLAWSPAYLMRVHALPAHETGLWLGALALTCSAGGVLVSGWLLDRRSVRGDNGAPFRVGMFGAAGVVPASLLLAFAGSKPASLAALALALFFASFPMPPSAAVIQRAVPPPMRARVGAVFLFCNSFLGLAAGALLIGLLNDRVFGGPVAIGLSLPLVTGCAGLAALLLLRAGIAPFTRRSA
jgi:MFS family permease